MNEEAIVDCVRLMQAADEILIANEEYLVGAYLSMAIELLLQRVGTEPYALPNTREKIVSTCAKW